MTSRAEDWFRLGADARGHSVTQLLAALPPSARPAEELIETAKELDKHYITPRYPNAYPEGAPMDFLHARGSAAGYYRSGADH